MIITGSKGYIGAEFSKLIQNFKAVDRSSGLLFEDITSEHHDYLIHFASSGSITNDAIVYENRSQKFKQFLNKNKFKKVIYISSFSVYDEFGKENPKSNYGKFKLNEEQHVKENSEDYLIIRICNPFGITDFNKKIINNGSTLLWNLAKAKINNSVFNFFGNAYRDYIHITDIAKIIHSIYDIHSGIKVVGSGTLVQTKEIIHSISSKHEIIIEESHIDSNISKINISDQEYSYLKMKKVKPEIIVDNIMKEFNSYLEIMKL